MTGLHSLGGAGNECHHLIQQTILNFAWRDQGRWAELRSLFGTGAEIHVSWYRGSVEGFIERSIAMAQSGAPTAKHLLFPPRIQVTGDRATAETDVIVTVRLPTASGEIDMTSWMRFLDRIAFDDGRWLIQHRTAIYERDRLDVVSGDPPELDAAAMTYPVPYRYMAFMLAQVGRSVRDDIVTAGSDAERDSISAAREWLGTAASPPA